MAIRTEDVLPIRAQSYATSSSECGFRESISKRTADSRSLSVTPGSEICRTVTSSRGRSMVAARCPTPSFCKKPVYAAPQSAAGCSRKCGMVSSPSTRAPLGRRRTTVTVSSWDPISIPMPVPMASHFAKSIVVIAVVLLQNRGVVIPTHDVEWRILFRGQQLDHSGGGPVQIEKLAVGKSKLGRGPKRHYAAASQTEPPHSPATVAKGSQLPHIQNGSDLAQGHNGRRGFWSHPYRHHPLRRNRTYVQRRDGAVDRQTVAQAVMQDELAFRIRRIAAVEQVRSNPSHQQ